jgi:hypothetical protein
MTIDHYEIFIVKPKASINLCTNPSFETGTTGWTKGGSNMIATSAVQQRRGVYSYKCTYINDDLLASYAITLTLADTEHVASMDIYIPSNYEGTQLTLTWTGFTNAAIVSGLADMTIRDKWQRVHCRINPDAGDLAGTLTLSETGTNGDAFEFIYIDGVQIEYGAEPTTYFDGSSEGFLGKEALEYYFDSKAHNTVSYRTVITRSGGEIIPFSDYCTPLLIPGLGIAPNQNIAIELVDGTKRYLYSRQSSRYFTIKVLFEGTTIGEIDADRLALKDLLDPAGSEFSQPLLLKVIGYTSAGVVSSEEVNIKCIYTSGLEESPQTNVSYATDITFEMFDVSMEIEGNKSKVLTNRGGIDDWCLIMQDVDGTWSGAEAQLDLDYVYDIKEDPYDGSVYVAGDFEEMNGDTSIKNLGRFNGLNVSPEWSPPVTGGYPNALVRAIAFDGAGGVFLAGSFTYAYLHNSPYNVKINADGSVTDMDNTAYQLCLLYDKDGYLWSGGGSALSRWNGTGWDVDSSIPGSTFTWIKQGPDGYIYVCSSANDEIYKGSFGSWTLIGTATGGNISDGEFDSKGNLIVLGFFTAMDGVSTPRMALYDGVNWKNIGSLGGVSSWGIRIYRDDDKMIFIGNFGYITPTSGKANIVLYNVAVYHGNNIWTPYDYYGTFASYTNRCFLKDSRGRVWFGGSDRMLGHTGAVTDVEVEHDTTYPVFQFVGEGYLYYLENMRSHKKILFNNLYIVPGETVTLDLRPYKLTLSSKLRGNLMEYILPGSNLDMVLHPGTNPIKLLFEDPPAGAAIVQYKERINSLDGYQR